MEERRGGNKISRAMREFTHFVEDLELIDPPLEGGIYTWSRGVNSRIVSRLDRFLFSADWDENFRDIKQVILPKVSSDHAPISLQCEVWENTKSYFKFENWWLGTEGFKDKIASWWVSFDVQSRPDYVLAKKLRLLKVKLKEWTGQGGNLEVLKTICLNKILVLDVVQESRDLSEDELVQKASLVMELEEIAKNEELIWRQKSRVQWLKQGDRNTKYFQRITNAHRRFNNIDKLNINGIQVDDKEVIKSWRPEFNFPDCPRISEAEEQWLQREFEEQEIIEG
uniref:Reverse transcriptase n=2 Tax=Nicotiana TaxID=4085 RepID=A0A1S4BP67_TOBAC|nr:PREDICTED: uncharacterized protein LOC104224793 [Nicotiana sylvestris]XP_016490633.1 PREDICTED: uncharacterized protein LOC107810374 [Nicotiana tabacum]